MKYPSSSSAVESQTKDEGSDGGVIANDGVMIDENEENEQEAKQ